MKNIFHNFLRKSEIPYEKKRDNFDYEGDPEDYARLVFRRYGRDGSYPAKRGHTILIIVLGVGLVLSFTLA